MKSFFVFLFCLFFSVGAQAQSLVLDSEVQAWLEAMAQPLLTAAGLERENLQFYVVGNTDINAFATPQRHVFMHSGLILEADTPDQVRGVLAHEIAHIDANHFVGRVQDFGRAQMTGLAGALIGIGTAIATGSSDAALAGALFGQGAGFSSILAHSRTDEREADQRGTDILHQAGYSAEGMVSFFKVINNHQLLAYRRQPGYLQTHPLSQERISNLSRKVESESAQLKAADPADLHKFSRIQARLYALTHSPMQTLRRYRGDSTPDRLARTIAHLLRGDMQAARAPLQALHQNLPDDPFVLELMAHTALEQQKFAQAAQGFADVIARRDDLLLPRLYLARAYQAQGKFEEALPALDILSHRKPDWPLVHEELGIVYGKLGRFGPGQLALATADLLRRKPQEMRGHLQQAQKHIEDSDVELATKMAGLLAELTALENNAR